MSSVSGTSSSMLLMATSFRKHPGWVHLILIRKVTDIAALGIESKNEPKRFEKAFKGVPDNVWHVFEDPQECYKLVADAVGN